jgi:hypothetical protein
MHAVTDKVFWCPRCGTLSNFPNGVRASNIPQLVTRCRKYQDGITEFVNGEWVSSGIAEAINLPKDRFT